MNMYDNNSEDNTSPTSGSSSTKYKGVRQRKWGKWVSEIRVPGSQARLWLGSYATAEAAAVAHDVAFYCLRRPDSLHGLNFPLTLPLSTLRQDMSPRSVQQAASDAGLAVDAHHQAAQFSSATAFPPAPPQQQQHWPPEPVSDGLSISVEDYL